MTLRVSALSGNSFWRRGKPGVFCSVPRISACIALVVWNRGRCVRFCRFQLSEFFSREAGFRGKLLTLWILIRDRRCGPAPGQSLLCLPALARLFPSAEPRWGARTVAGTRSLPRLPTLQTSWGKTGPASPAESGLRWRKYAGTSGWGPKWLLNLGAETTLSPLRPRWSD